MKMKLTRRQFGYMAIAGTATTALGVLANRTSAQTSLIIYGARPERRFGRIVVQSLNVATGEIQDIATTSFEAGEQLSGFTNLSDGTFVLAISPVSGGRRERNATRLAFVGGASARPPVTVTGLNRQQKIDSLLAANDGSLLALASRRNSRPPVALVSISPDTGQVISTNRINLPQTDRFSTLAQCPNGTIYSIVTSRTGETSLVQLSLAQGRPIVGSQLKFDSTAWNSGLFDLACSPAEQLVALGAPRYDPLNKLYSLNPSNGEMNLIRAWQVTKITIPRGV
ncbi:hypothetical protein [Gloeocapsopsis sp. IPPAS B-1203]|uniref:hypothetical protein n=1 Tax=Gloeocapsopsis sp. IPPAS B-1203 TaxID=2049454 RepID=UPI00117F8092|nr:hypothetical protein [Gloeocapsopsis sp. IPPAS B-1203]